MSMAATKLEREPRKMAAEHVTEATHAEGAPHAWTPQAGRVAASTGHGWTFGCEAAGRLDVKLPPARCASTSAHACSPAPPSRAMAARAAPPHARARAAPVPRQLTRAGVAFRKRGRDGRSGRGERRAGQRTAWFRRRMPGCRRRQSWACARDEGATGQEISRPPPDTHAPGRRRPEGPAAADAAKGRRQPNPSPDLEE